MKSKLSRISGYLLTAMLILSIVYIAAPVKAVTASIELINAENGTSSFVYTSAQKSVNDLITINITVVNVIDLFSWQVKVSWDPTLLTYDSITLPADHVFAGQTNYPAGPVVASGNVVYGVSLGPGGNTFNGTGRLAVLKLKIIQGVSQGGPVSVSCNLNLVNPPPAAPPDTFLLNGVGGDITFTTVNAFYSLTWVAPSTLPSFYITPASITPSGNDTVFSFDVYIKDVDAGWEIIALQFSIAWNTTFMSPEAPYYSNGSFLEAFQYAPGGVFYAADINTHYRPPPLTPLPPDYNYSTIGMLLLPDFGANFTYHPPFPSGGGKLATLYFRAIYATFLPLIDTTMINFIGEDVLVMNKYGLDVGHNMTTGALYTAPALSLGLAIDVYTQYPFPYGGQGGNKTSDSFGPQQQVELYALVTYNEYPVQQKLVGFEIAHLGSLGWFDVFREGTTDANGVAHVSVRLPWPCSDPLNQIFGWWTVNATVEVAEQKTIDNLKFFVYWPVEVVSIVPKESSYQQRKTGGDALTFTVVYQRYDQQDVPVVVTVTLYDELGFFIGSAYKVDTIGGADYSGVSIDNNVWPTPTVKTWDVSIPMPTNAVVGMGTAYANAFDTFPWYLGTPYCPEVKCNFLIVK